MKKVKLIAEPYAVVKTTARKGGVNWNFYDSQERQYLQVSDNDHGQKSESIFGRHGEHAHWYEYDKDGHLVHGKADEIPSFVRDRLGDKL